ncbi:uncharacterized protein EV422DRAFT_622146 [Fimicolochytrium jonesii]|uniref:uncharacterized protein n=1 Tax=Fimicolochytrium jonesii TaxID=1396493 RepID=UPI0022FEE718|nr:uncharacterized protein EV422DRAFT_622146 [Fimicolochytrium jonesii]KAI8817939.1 hypothetical protein EV422DRAFT_622146 [Fimicolochytrium jonesii]
MKPRAAFHLEKAGLPVYGGDVLTGLLEVEAIDNTIKSMEVQCLGVIQFANAANLPLGTIVKQAATPEDVRHVLFRQVMALPVHQGSQFYPFNFPLVMTTGDPYLPSSINTTHLSITYLLVLTLLRSWPRENLMRYHKFTVAARHDTNLPLYRIPQSASRDCDVGVLGRFKKGTVEARVSIPRSAYCKGDRIPIRLQMNHLANVKRVTKATVALKREIRWVCKKATVNPLHAAMCAPPDSGCAKTRYSAATIGEAALQLDIKPGAVNVDMKAYYHLDPLSCPPHEKPRKPLPPPVNPVLHHSDFFPWSTDPTADNSVDVSYQLLVELQIGGSGGAKEEKASSKNLTTDATHLVATKKGSDSDASILDGALSGSKKVLQFSFPITIGNVPFIDDEPSSLPQERLYNPPPHAPPPAPRPVPAPPVLPNRPPMPPQPQPSPSTPPLFVMQKPNPSAPPAPFMRSVSESAIASTANLSPTSLGTAMPPIIMPRVPHQARSLPPIPLEASSATSTTQPAVTRPLHAPPSSTIAAATLTKIRGGRPMYPPPPAIVPRHTNSSNFTPSTPSTPYSQQSSPPADDELSSYFSSSPVQSPSLSSSFSQPRHAAPSVISLAFTPTAPAENENHEVGRGSLLAPAAECREQDGQEAFGANDASMQAADDEWDVQEGEAPPPYTLFA